MICAFTLTFKAATIRLRVKFLFFLHCFERPLVAFFYKLVDVFANTSFETIVHGLANPSADLFVIHSQKVRYKAHNVDH